MSNNKLTRRDFLKTLCATGAAVAVGASTTSTLLAQDNETPVRKQWFVNGNHRSDGNVMSCVTMTDTTSSDFKFSYIKANTVLTEGDLVDIACDPLGWNQPYITLTDNDGRTFYFPARSWEMLTTELGLGWFTSL